MEEDPYVCMAHCVCKMNSVTLIVNVVSQADYKTAVADAELAKLRAKVSCPFPEVDHSHHVEYSVNFREGGGRGLGKNLQIIKSRGP